MANEEYKKLPQFTTRIERNGGAVVISIFVPVNYLRKVVMGNNDE